MSSCLRALITEKHHQPHIKPIQRIQYYISLSSHLTQIDHKENNTTNEKVDTTTNKEDWYNTTIEEDWYNTTNKDDGITKEGNDNIGEDFVIIDIETVICFDYESSI